MNSGKASLIILVAINYVVSLVNSEAQFSYALHIWNSTMLKRGCKCPRIGTNVRRTHSISQGWFWRILLFSWRSKRRCRPNVLPTFRLQQFRLVLHIDCLGDIHWGVNIHSRWLWWLLNHLLFLRWSLRNVKHYALLCLPLTFFMNIPGFKECLSSFIYWDKLQVELFYRFFSGIQGAAGFVLNAKWYLKEALLYWWPLPELDVNRLVTFIYLRVDDSMETFTCIWSPFINDLVHGGILPA